MAYTTETFITKGNLKHNNLYDYSKTIYKNSQEDLIIICKKHGEFLQKAINHLHHGGCKKCGRERIVLSSFSNLDTFITKANLKHNNLYLYSKTIYYKKDEKLIITCKEHGDFLQTPASHLRGSGCSLCAKKRLSDMFKKNDNKFIEEANLVHFNKYTYDKVIYLENSEKVIITCAKHGDFLQAPKPHLSGRGCPKCRISKGELRIEQYLIVNNIKYEYQKKFKDCKGLKYSLPFDFYLNDYNILIEYDGEQHFYPVTFGSKDEKYFNYKFDKVQLHDSIKTKYCLNNNIKLLRIPYTEYKNTENIIKNYLL